MKLRKTLAAAGALAIAGSLTVVAQPAAAACTEPDVACADTEVTFTITNGLLSIDVAGTTIDLTGGVTNTLTGTQVAGSLLETTVTDERNSTAGWTASGTVEDFTSPGADNTAGNADDGTIDCSNATLGAAGLTQEDPVSMIVGFGGTVPAAALSTVTMSACASPLAVQLPFTALVTSVLNANNSASYTPSITVTVPPNTPNGEYTGNVMQTVV